MEPLEYNLAASSKQGCMVLAADLFHKDLQHLYHDVFAAAEKTRANFIRCGAWFEERLVFGQAWHLLAWMEQLQAPTGAFKAKVRDRGTCTSQVSAILHVQKTK